MEKPSLRYVAAFLILGECAILILSLESFLNSEMQVKSEKLAYYCLIVFGKNPRTKRNLKMTIDAVIRTFMISVILLTFTACTTERNCDPDTFVRVRGEVINVNRGEGIANAQVHIEADEGQTRQCPEFTEDFTVDLETNQDGYFDLNNSAQGFAEFTITISHDECETYTYTGDFFTFYTENPRTFTIYCPE